MSLITAKTEQELMALLEGIKNGTIIPGNGTPSSYANTSVLIDENSKPLQRSQGESYKAPNLPPAPEPSRARSARNAVKSGLGSVEAALGLTEVSRSQTKALAQGIQSGSKMFGAAPTVAARNGRLAMQALRHPALVAGLKWAGPVGAAMAVGDTIFGDESAANKGMDAALMTAGGFLGSTVPVVGTGIGIAAGKMVSDGTQFLFGGGKSPAERELEQALALLQQRGLV